ncbi:MAG: ABC transporter permease subunit [Candidatus Bathyarchaeia archaeon]
MSGAKPHTNSTRISTRLLLFLERASAKPNIIKGVYSVGLLFFMLIVIIPAVAGIVAQLFSLPTLALGAAVLTRMESAVSWSFIIGLTVSSLDLLAGVPLAWLIVRRRGNWATVLDSLADIPFVVPTVALGFSILEFWSSPDGIAQLFGSNSLVPPGVILIMLLHFAFSFPVIVRVMVGEFLNYRETYEVAARTLGASTFTAVRTVTLPILRTGLLAAFLLALARSLSETGATIVVAGAFENGTVFISNARNAGQTSAVVLASLILILSSLVVFGVIKVVAPRIRVAPLRVWPDFERKLSKSSVVTVRNIASVAIFMAFVLFPCLFIALPAIMAVASGTATEAIAGAGPWKAFWSSMLLSYVIAVLATVVNIVSGLPMAILIARNRFGTGITKIVDALVDLPIIVPSLALGVSLSFFWKNMGSLPEFWVIVLAHTTITYSYFVRTMTASIQEVQPELEDAAKTLGAQPLRVFRKITLPLTKYALLSGAILVFTRSVDETGATSAVSKTLKTAPILLVSWIKGTVSVTSPERALGVGFLVATSFLALVVLRLIAIRQPSRKVG